MSVDAAGIAARLQQAGAPGLCLLPSAAIAGEVKQGFGGTCQLPLLLPLPQLVSAAMRLPIDTPDLPAVAALLPVEGEDSERLWQIYDALRPHCGEGYSPPARLQLAKKLAALFGEVEKHLPTADGGNPFAALREGEGGGLSHEGEVAAAVWDLLGGEVTTHQPRLHALAPKLPPLLAVCDESTTPAQRAFYDACGAEVVMLQPLPMEEVWRQAFTLEGEMPDTCTHTAREGVGNTLTETARLALTAIHDWLATSGAEEQLGVVVYDRLLARRLRAMAETAKVLMADKSGWRAETLSYGAALSHCAAVLMGEFSLTAVRQLLQPPFYAGHPALAEVAQEWQKLFADALTLPENAAELRDCGGGDFPVLDEVLQGIANAQEKAATLNQTAAEWLAWCEGATADMLAAWQDDSVAEALMEKLKRRAMRSGELSGVEFLLWLEDALQSERAGEDNITSRVVFVEPGSRRQFSALLLLGCTGKRSSDDTGWLGEGERERLKLPTTADRLHLDRCRFSHHLAHHAQIAAVWCAVDDAGKPQPPNPFWRLFAEHCRRHERLGQLVGAVDDSLKGEETPTGAAWVARDLPARLSPSTADTLMKCPYLFYAQHGLQLRDEEEEDLDEVSPRLRGTLLHRALAKFSEDSRDMESAEDMMACWQELLVKRMRGNRPGLQLLLDYWLINSDWFIEWERERRENGWQTKGMEQRIAATLMLNGGEVTLSGRIDRLDANEDGRLSVIDYKSGGLPTSKNLAGGEAPQLPLYAFFAGAGGQVTEQLLCRPLHRDSRQMVGKASPRRVAARLRRVLRQAAAGTPLPANGTLSNACKDCPTAGLCRRDYWQT